MDKETLSQYGWVVICIIVIAILLGLATPFGNFVKDSVMNTTGSFGQKITASLDAAGANGSGGSEDSGDEFNPEDLGEAIQMWDISEEPGAKKVWMTYYQPDIAAVADDGYTDIENGTTTKLYENGTIYIAGEGRMEKDIYNYFMDINGCKQQLLEWCEEMTGYKCTVGFNRPSDDFATTWSSAFAYINDATAGPYNDRDVEIGDFELDLTDSRIYKFKPTNVIFDEGVTNISSNAFRYIPIESIKLPSSLEIIEDYAFYGSGLLSITIPNNVTSIGERAFSDCYNLKSIEFPNNLENIGKSSFVNCRSLTSISVPDNVKIEFFAFAYCTNLSSIKLGDNISLDRLVFQDTPLWNDFTNQKNEDLYIDGYLIDVYQYIYGPYDIKAGTKGMACDAFSQCWHITSITIPNGIKYIPDSFFSGCEELNTITIPESVIEIGEQVFKSTDLNTIKGVAGSYAETYANNNGYNFVAI